MLWDTPGFGDSVRLQRRLAAQRPAGRLVPVAGVGPLRRPCVLVQPAGACARRANRRTSCCTSSTRPKNRPPPVTSSPNCSILDWLGKPTLVLLNQVGTRPDPCAKRHLHRRVERDAAPARIRTGARRRAVVRCLRALLAAGTRAARSHPGCLEPELHGGFEPVRAAWRARDVQVLQRSAQVIAAAAVAARHATKRAWPRVARRQGAPWFRPDSSAGSPVEERAQRELSQRLDASVRAQHRSTRRAARPDRHGRRRTAPGHGREFDTQRAPDADASDCWVGWSAVRSAAWRRTSLPAG